ncbi:ATP-binding protein, partial [Staphylococcus xylosus]
MNPFETLANKVEFKNELVEQEHNLMCEQCGRKYDWYKFAPTVKYPDGYEYRDGCDCELIAQFKKAEELREQKRIDNTFNQSMINPSIKHATVNNYQPNNESQQYAKTTAIEYVTNFSTKENETKSILFRGSYGTGKSHLAYAIAKAIKQQGYTVAFMQIPELMDRIKATYNKNSEERTDELINHLVDIDLLILDDIGVENTEHALSKLYGII